MNDDKLMELLDLATEQYAPPPGTKPHYQKADRACTNTAANKRIIGKCLSSVFQIDADA